MKTILLAPNAFKNSLSAREAALALKKGLEKSGLVHQSIVFPVGDGGDGTGSLLMDQPGAKNIEVETIDALGRPISASIGLVQDGTAAIIEMAAASGIGLLQSTELNPLQSNSMGTGILIRTALDLGVKTIILTLGGSATVDGGAGMLHTLGVRFSDQQGRQLKPVPADLTRINSMDITGLDNRIRGCRLVVLCDVKNPLLGINGAARVYGPQKGAGSEAVIQLEEFLTKLTGVVREETGKDMSVYLHGGAAGGVAAGLAAVLNAILVQGIEYFLDVTGFDRALEKSDLVITGEGSLDDQTLQGKGPFGVAVRAKKRQLPVIGVAGIRPATPSEELKKYFDEIIQIGDGRVSEAAFRQTAHNLEQAAYDIGRRLGAAGQTADS